MHNLFGHNEKHMMEPVVKIFKIKREELVPLVGKLSAMSCFFFADSSLVHPLRGRFSFFSAEPFYTVRGKGRDSLLALSQIERILGVYQTGNNTVFPFVSGGVGFFSYDLGFQFESIPRKNTDDTGLDDVFFNFYDVIFAYDNLKEELHVFSWGFPERSRRARKIKACLRLEYFLGFLFGPGRKLNGFRMKGLRSNFSYPEYIEAVKRCRDYIKKGDIYQLNLSQRFSASFEGDAFGLYKILRDVSPSYFSLFLKGDDFCVLSSSPEEFLRFDGRSVWTVPMKGTRPRFFDNPYGDKNARISLSRSKKEKAELLMIVDLLRNDLGRVCRFGSVKVDKLRQIEKYSTVYQATSTISGILRKDKSLMDLIRACFPGGSITGCPKIRAMQIIEELEPSVRALYTGSAGFISFHHTLNLNILIRTILIKNRKLYFSVGGGIVYDSSPRREYEETMVKARGIFSSLKRGVFSGETDLKSDRQSLELQESYV